MKDANKTKAQLMNELHMMQFSMDNALDRIAWIAPDGRFLYANKAACKEMHYSREEILSMTLPDVDPNYSLKRWKEHFQELKKIGSMQLQTEQIDGEGQTHYLDVSSSYLKFGDKEFICSYGRDITELKIAEQALAEQLEFERVLADIAANLAHAESDLLEEVIDAVLQVLGRFLHTERAFFARFSEDGNSLRLTNIWVSEGIKLPPELFEVDLTSEIPWLPKHILNNGLINAGPGLTGLPEEAKDLRNWLKINGVKSCMAVPVRVEGRSIGMLGLDTVVQEREYPKSIVDRMRTVADMIGSTMHRIRTQLKLDQYQHIVESTTSIVGLVDKKYVYQYVNNAYCAAFKKDQQEIIGGTVADLFGHELFDQTLSKQYDRCFAGEEVNFQSWFDLPGWGNRFMDVRYSPFFGPDRKVVAVVVSAHDITEIKQLEMKLKESEERFRTFMDNNPASIYIKDENDIHIYANPAAFTSTGKAPDELIGSTTRDIFPNEAAAKLIELDREVLRGKTPQVTEEWRNTTKGATRWFRDIKFPISLESGKRLLGGIALDITELKQSEKKLQNAYNEIKLLKEKVEQENIYLRKEIELQHEHGEIVGKSKPVINMLALAEQVAETDTTVLILGETGTGKELLVRAIHNLSSRKDRTMIIANCAALPSTLIESELFGRERGAYTGALSRQIGRFEMADQSTIFLDEIGELPLGLQAKLLRVLQEGQFERLGSPQTIRADVRIIASTNRDLAQAVTDGKFREDLYYRLNVFSITVPPLRDRIEDIPMLVWAFVKEFEKSMGKSVEKVPARSIDALQQYSWPGNVRELRNIVENAMILCKDKTLQLIPPTDSTLKSQSDLSLETLERDHIIEVLKKTSWRVSGEKGAAILLGLKPTTLDARMKKLGIERPR